MKSKPQKFVRRSFYVDALRVNDTNIEEVADWCGGHIETDENGNKYIKVNVRRAMSDRQTQAFFGDWVLKAGSGFKVYNARVFSKAFEKVKQLSKPEADRAGIAPPIEPSQPPEPAMTHNPALTNPTEVEDSVV